jgi:hypothetical protein
VHAVHAFGVVAKHMRGVAPKGATRLTPVNLKKEKPKGAGLEAACFKRFAGSRIARQGQNPVAAAIASVYRGNPLYPAVE